MPIHERRLAGRCCIISERPAERALRCVAIGRKIICSLAPMPAAAAPIAYERTDHRRTNIVAYSDVLDDGRNRARARRRGLTLPMLLILVKE